MKIGIFLGYGPGVQLGKEGLGRYLANLVKYVKKSGHEVEIACSRWLVDSIDDLFEDFKIDDKSISYTVVQQIPIVWKIYDWKNHKKKKTKRNIFRMGVKTALDFAMDYILDISSCLVAIIVALLTLVVGIICVPIVLACALIYTLFYALQCLLQSNKSFVKGLYGKIIRAYEGISDYGINFYFIVYYKMIGNMHQRLVKRINRDTKDVDIWYSPAAFWPAFNQIKGTRILNVPDLVTKVFASTWGDNTLTLLSSNNTIKTIEGASYYITYSEFIKQTCLIDDFAVESSNIRVIAHAMNRLDEYITISDDVLCSNALSEQFKISYCNNIINAMKNHVMNLGDYMYKFDFRDVQFMFYPTQNRPYKNILNLIKAYEILLRKYHIQLKLILTCYLGDIKDIEEYIKKKRLQYDVLSFYNVDTKGLAALYARATLVVNPTLYEGGFPFTFGEGMSVDTPSVMSRIPQVIEVVDEKAWDKMLFDPYDIDDMVRKIYYCYQNIDEIYSIEKETYDLLNARSWEDVAGEYVEAFKYFADK